MPQWQRKSTPLLWSVVFLKSATALPLCGTMFGQCHSASMTFGIHVFDFEGNRSTWGKPTQMFFPYRHKDRELRPGPFHWPSFKVSLIFEKERYNSKALKRIKAEYYESLSRILQSQNIDLQMSTGLWSSYMNRSSQVYCKYEHTKYLTSWIVW